MLRVEQCEEVMKSSSLEVSRTEEFCFFAVCAVVSLILQLSFRATRCDDRRLN